MASEVEICNLALQRLGQQANLIDISENSVYAETAKHSLPIVRDSLLERHAWNFATTRVRMPKMKERPIGWTASYKVPSDCVRVLTVYEERPKDFWEGKTWVVEMQGDGFTLHVAQGERVEAGQKLLDIDIDKIRAAGFDPVTMCLVAEHTCAGELNKHADGTVTTQDTAIWFA